MPHPRDGYKLKDGSKVPSVTEVLKYKDCGPLMHWANKEGLSGRYHRDSSAKAADAGSMGHAMIEAWAAGQNPDDIIGPEEELAKARNGFGAFLRWAGTSKLTIIKSEVSLVSEVHRFAGTLDSTMAVSVHGKLAMSDYKFSNGVYAEYLIQIAAYAILYEENFPGEKIEEYHLLRFSKDYCDFSHRSWVDLETGKQAFLHMLAYHNLKVELDKRAK